MTALREEDEQRHNQTAPSMPTTPRTRRVRAKGPDKVAPPRAKRAQVARACQRCRRLQKACSDSRPCLRCVRAGLAEVCGSFTSQHLVRSQVRPSRVRGPGEVAAHGDAGSFKFAVPPAFVNLDLPASPKAFASFWRESFKRKAALLPPQVIDYCSGRFFECLSPTIPILTPEYVAILRSRASSEDGSEAYCVLLGLCAMVMLQVDDARGKSFGQSIVAENNAGYGWLLLEEVLAAHRHLMRKSSPSLDSVLLVFFIYACHAIMFHHSQAFFFIREATTLFLLIKPESMDDLSRTLAERLFWVLLISERSHAIRYRRPSTLQVTAFNIGLPPSGEGDNHSLSGFRCLAALFRALDTSFIALLNQEVVPRLLPPGSLDEVEMAINTALNYSGPDSLLPTQTANLRVTQLWLRIVLWQLRLRLGHLSEQSTQSSRTYHYPLQVAKDLTISTRDLPVLSIQVHGVGITEKVFDIACAVVNVLARGPIQITKTAAEDDLKYIRRLILQLRGGATVYDALLLNHVQQTLPRMVAELDAWDTSSIGFDT
ncbi:hypothetical protein AAE478_001406 [Parahypoxylon ruwenzoriense]